jgi:hypothetical protein
MCDRLNVLQHAPDGHVSVCRSYRTFQVAFGTTRMTLDLAAMEELVEELGSEVDLFAGRIGEGEKAFVHGVGEGPVRLVLCYTEMVRLHALLRDALWVHGIYAVVTKHDD